MTRNLNCPGDFASGALHLGVASGWKSQGWTVEEDCRHLGKAARILLRLIALEKE